jgi:hypothetical protein
MKQLIIAGCPRSGTTALGHLLNRDSKTFIGHETNCYIYGKKPFSNRLAWQAADKNERNFREPFTLKGLDYNDLPEFQTGLDFIKYMASLGFEVVGDKNPEYIMRRSMRAVLNKVSDIKVIMTIRDARGFIASSLRAWKSGLRDHWCFDNIADAEYFWTTRNHELLHLIRNDFIISPEQYKIVKYEPASQDAVSTVYHLSKFIGYEFKINNPEGYFFPVNADAWQDEIPHINNQLKPDTLRLMELFGYCL